MRTGDVLLVDVPDPIDGPRTRRAVIESVQGDTVRVALCGVFGTRAYDQLCPELRVWAAYRHDTGVYTMTATVAARLDERPLRVVLRIASHVDRQDDRAELRRRTTVPVTIYVAGTHGFTPHTTT